MLDRTHLRVVDLDEAVLVASALAYYAWNVGLYRRALALVEKCWPDATLTRDIDVAKWEKRLSKDLIPFANMDNLTRRSYVQLALEWAKENM